MKTLLIALSLTAIGLSQQPQADIVKTSVLDYDKTTTRIVVSVKNISAAEFYNVWVNVSSDTSSKVYRRKIPLLKQKDARQVTIDASNDAGPWRASIDSVDYLNAQP